MNHNVRLVLHWSLWENFSASVRSGDVLSAFIYLLTKNNETVGYLQGVNGICQMLAALPAGVLTDRWRRDTMLRVAAAVGLVAGLFLAWTMLAAPSLGHIAAAMALLGCYRGLYNPPLESIFADSVRAGRSGLYTRKYIITVLASGCGPLLSLLLFFWLGNQWEAADCRHVLLWGLAVMAVPLILMCLFNDDKALGHHSDHIRLHSAAKQPGDEEEAAQQGPQRAKGCCRGCCSCCVGLSPGLAVTLLISFSDLIGALASGMTLKFFALFFMQVCQVSPATVSLLGALAPLGISAASVLSQRASHTVGRVQVSLSTRAADVALLVSMAYLPTASEGARRLLMCVHLLRMALANCTRPLLRSVLMDAVPKRHRGKVNAVDSVRSFSWSGSAALGGLLIERFGFQTTFLITAGMKLAAFVPLFVLLRYVSDGWLAGGQRAAAAEGAGYDVVPENAAAVEAAAAVTAAAVAAEGMQRAGGASAGRGLPPPQQQQQQHLQPGGRASDAALTAPLLGGEAEARGEGGSRGH